MDGCVEKLDPAGRMFSDDAFAIVIYVGVANEYRGVFMKFCPNCNEQLPDAAHFCPKCMFQYEEKKSDTGVHTDIQGKTKWAIILVVFMVAILSVGGGSVLKKEMGVQNGNAENEDTDISQIIDGNFRKEAGKLEDSYLDIDCKDMLIEFVEVQKILGEETAGVINDGAFEIHTFNNVEVVVNELGNVQQIMIDYTQGATDKEYGVYGVGSRADLDDVEELLGIPDQEYGKSEYYYRFDRELNPSLHIIFSDDGMIEQLEYYYVR